MPRTRGAVTLGLTFLLAGCDAETPEGSASYECTPQVRMNGQVYDGRGYTDQRATRFARADEAECHDVGQSAPGSIFTDDPRQVAVWTFADHSPERVLGVRLDHDSFLVLIAASVPLQEAERIERALRTD